MFYASFVVGCTLLLWLPGSQARKRVYPTTKKLIVFVRIMEEKETAGIDGFRYKNPLLIGLSIIWSISGYIFGPMILFGGTGLWLGNRFDSLLFPIIFFLVAIVISNVLIFKRSHLIAKRLSSK